MKSAREKALDLVRLATADTAAVGERTNAALAACRMIARHDLLAGPQPEYRSGFGDYAAPRASRPVRAVVQSHQVVLDASALCRTCMERMPKGATCHRVDGRGYQCQDCGPWSAEVLA